MKKTAYLTCAVLTALSLPVYAAENTSSQAQNQNVTTKNVIVTATRTEAELKTVPNTAEVITSDEIEKMGAQDVTSVLKRADNIQVIDSAAGAGFGHKIIMRGMSADNILILINGQRVADEDTGTTHNAYALDRINVHNVDRIEIIRGSASAQYGSDAMAGVINIITKQSQGSEPSVTVGLNTGTASMSNYYHVDLGQTGKFNGTFDMEFTKDRNYGTYNYNNMINEDILSGPKQYFNFSGNYQVGENKNLNLSLGYNKVKTSGDWNWANSRFLSMYGAMSDAKINSERRDISLGYTGKSKKNDWLLRTYYSKLNKDRTLPYVSNIARMGARYSTAMANSTATESNDFGYWGIEGKNSHKIDGDHTLTYGAEFNKYEASGDNFKARTYTGNGADFTTWAGYLQDEWLIGNKWIVIPAVRYDKNSRFGGRTTPRIGATYLLDDNNRLKANWGEGYKAPTLSELYMGYYHMTLIEGNPDLRPETSKGYDLSYEGDWGKLSTKLTYFNNSIDHMISYKKFPGNSYYTYYNMDGTTKLHGIEWSLNQKISPLWNAKLSSNWTSASNSATAATSGHGVNGVAKNVTTLSFDYDDNKDNGWSGSIYEQWFNKYYDTEAQDEFTYNTFNFVINKKFSPKAHAYFGMDNVFDKKINDLYLYGRMWRTGVEFTF